MSVSKLKAGNSSGNNIWAALLPNRACSLPFILGFDEVRPWGKNPSGSDMEHLPHLVQWICKLEYVKNLGLRALKALPQTSSVVVVISHNVCSSSLYKHLVTDLLQNITDVSPDTPALFLCIPSSSDPGRQFFSLLLVRTLRFEWHNEIWSPRYPRDLLW